MKEIIYNNDNLKEEDINRVVIRIKAVIVNSNNEILLCFSKNNYHLPGGHLEEGESLAEGLVREIEEETGVIIPIKERTPFLRINYMNRDYPSDGLNTKSIANYYVINYDLMPNLDNLNLTEEEKRDNFELRYISKEKVLHELQESLKTCTRDGAVKDTIEAIKEYLKISTKK